MIILDVEVLDEEGNIFEIEEQNYMNLSVNLSELSISQGKISGSMNRIGNFDIIVKADGIVSDPWSIEIYEAFGVDHDEVVLT